MSNNKIIVFLIAALLACALLLAGCGSDVTTDTGAPTCTPTATPEPTATPDPLDSLTDVADKALLLYERYEAYYDKVNSVKENADSVVKITMNGQTITSTQKSEVIKYGLIDGNYVEYGIIESDYEGEKTKIETGFADNYYFYDSGTGAKLKAPISAEDYIKKSEEDNDVWDKALTPTKQRCAYINAILNADNKWVLTFKDYDVESSMAIFKEVTGEFYAMYGAMMASCSVEYTLIMNADGLPEREILKINCKPLPEYAVTLSFEMDGVYSDINAVAKAPVVDLSEYVQVPDIDVLDEIADSLIAFSEGQEGAFDSYSSVVLTGDVYYYYTEINNVSFTHKDGVLKFDVPIVMENGTDPTNHEKTTGVVSYDGSNMYYKLGDSEQTVQMGKAEVMSIITNPYISIIPKVEDVQTFTVTETDAGREIVIVGSEYLIDEEGLGGLATLTGIEWTATKGNAEYKIVLDSDGNVTYIMRNISVEASYETYKTKLDVKSEVIFK